MRLQDFPSILFAAQYELKRIIMILVIAAFPISMVSPANAIENLAYPAGIVVDAKTGSVLYANKADNKRYPASVTKVMTLYVLYQELTAGRVSLSTKITASQHAANARPTKLGLRPGSTLTVEEAILSMIITSANDSSRAVAELISGSEERFAKRMTATARALGMRHTNYANASGWPDPNNYTTARDQAILGVAMHQHFPQFYHYFKRTSMSWGGKTYSGHNNVLGHKNIIDGLKTGWTSSSGSTILTSARGKKKHIVVVAFGYPGAKARDKEVRKLVDVYFQKAHAGDYWRKSIIARAPMPTNLTVLASRGATPLNGLPPIRPDEIITAGIATSVAPVPQLPDRPTKTGLKDATQVAYAPQRESQKDDPIGAWIAKSLQLPPHTERQKAEEGRINADTVTRWIIQIGAVDTPESARELLNHATNINASLGSIQSYVEPVKRNGRTFYRARFAGFVNRTQASNACVALSEASIACLAMSG